MEKSRPLKILFIGVKDIGLEIQGQLQDIERSDEVETVYSVEKGVRRLRDQRNLFDLIIVMDSVDGKIGAAQQVMKASREICPDTSIIQIGSDSNGKGTRKLAPNYIWELSTDFSDLVQMILELCE